MSRGLALYYSLLEQDPSFKLYILLFDDASYNILHSLKLEYAVLINLEEFETEELLLAKQDRTLVEYMWTSTPHIIRYVLDNYDVDHATYVDADIFFFEDPNVILKEFYDSKKSVLLTKHNYSPEYDQTESAGIYCVQFMTFRKTSEGLQVLQWWQDRVIEWCYARMEDGKFGDQKYLDDWPSRFSGIHVLKHLGGGVAPWNIQQYRLFQDSKKVKFEEIATNETYDLVFYHYHRFIIYSNNLVNYTYYKITKTDKKLIYRPYIEMLKSIGNDLKFITNLNIHGKQPMNESIRTKLKRVKRLILGKNNLHIFR